MIFISGGSYQGKYAFAREAFAVSPEETYRCSCTEGLDFSKPVICGLHAFHFGCEKRGEDPVRFLKENKEKFKDKIVISDDISRGVVPIDREERAWREANGRCHILLAEWADEVYNVFCGIPTRIKAKNPDFPSRIIYIRHGTTEGNIKNWYYGAMDLSLTEAGKALLTENRKAGMYPPLPDDALIFTSGMKRTKQTLQAIYGQRTGEVEEEIREMNFGVFEGKSFDMLADDPAFLAWGYDTEGDVAIAEGESRNAFKQRVRRGFDRIEKKHFRRAVGGERDTSLVISHGGPLSLLMADRFPKEKDTMWAWMPKPGEGYIVSYRGRTPVSFEKIGEPDAG